ncbi:hypothetical protein C0992_006486, partial [Termitomyces sp. T32_za158]
MASRYSLRSQPAGTSARRLSPTAVRQTGPLQRRVKKLEEPEPTLMTPPDTEPDSSTGPSVSASYATMPTEMIVDATELKAGVNVGSLENDASEESSLTSSLTDEDERQYMSTVDPDSVVDQYSINSTTPTTKLTREPEQTELDEQLIHDVSVARDHMTSEERNSVDRRMNRVNPERSGPNQRTYPQNKDKGIDPRNWGALNLDEAEYDPQIQREILAEYNLLGNIEPEPLLRSPEHHAQITDVGDAADGETMTGPEKKGVEFEDQEVTREEVLEYLHHKKQLHREMDRHRKREKTSHRRRKERAGSEPLSNELAALIHKVAEGSGRTRKYKGSSKKDQGNDNHPATKPITQITAKSALGRAFGRLQKRQRPESSDGSSSDTSSESDSESEYGSGYSSEPSESSDSSSSPSHGSRSSSRSRGRRKSSRRHRSSHRRRTPRHRKRVRQTIIKPTPPDKYDGRVDIRAFHKFLTHGTAYVKYGYVERRRQVMVLSEFLTGKAYTFYSRSVSLDPESWTLNRFFVELFNYCFPIDFRGQQRERLNNLTQGNKSVREYVADLDELFTIVGADSKRARVVKLFNGFRPSLRKALFREHMNPEYTSWKDMITEAEYQEMADNVDLREHNNGNNQGRGNGSSRNQGSGTKGEPSNHGKQSSPNKSNSNPSAAGASTGGSNGNNQSHHQKNGKQRAKGKTNKYPGKELSKEQKDELRAENKCFFCKKEGHFARNCQEKGKAKSGSNKPLGVSTFGMQIDLDQTEQLRVASLNETTELSIGMMGWIDTSPDHKEYDSDGDSIPDLQSISDSESEASRDDDEMTGTALALVDALWGNYHPSASLTDDIMVAPPATFRSSFWMTVDNSEERLTLLDTYDKRARLGNAVCNKVAELLETMQPYPGDPANVLQFRPQRFVVTPVLCGDEILVHDRVFDHFEVLSKSAASRGQFPIGDWYAKRRQERTGAPYKQRAYYQTCLCADAQIWNARRTLEMGAPYPHDEVDKVHQYRRFEVLLDGNNCCVYDRHLGLNVQLSATHLQNEYFDLAGWYKKQIRRSFDKLSLEAPTLPYDPNYYIACLYDDNVPIALAEHEPEIDLIRTWASAFGKLHLEVEGGRLQVLGLNGQQIPAGKYPSIQRNAAFARDPARQVPKPLVVVVHINGHPARAL